MLPAAQHAKRLRAKVRVDSGLGTGRQLHARLQLVGCKNIVILQVTCNDSRVLRCDADASVRSNSAGHAALQCAACSRLVSNSQSDCRSSCLAVTSCAELRQLLLQITAFAFIDVITRFLPATVIDSTALGTVGRPDVTLAVKKLWLHLVASHSQATCMMRMLFGFVDWLVELRIYSTHAAQQLSHATF
jgi:hypothetical protein